jgi:hypothetical protein
MLTQLRWSRHNHRRCWTSLQNTTSRMHLKKWQRGGNGARAQKGTTLGGGDDGE